MRPAYLVDAEDVGLHDLVPPLQGRRSDAVANVQLVEPRADVALQGAAPLAQVGRVGGGGGVGAAAGGVGVEQVGDGVVGGGGHGGVDVVDQAAAAVGRPGMVYCHCL